MVFCTLFDSNYLDKGLVMYRSLAATGCRFKMYVLAMDEKCEEILKAYGYDNVTVISLERFVEEASLADVRKTRSRAEFCWTCTSFLIDHVIKKYGESICTYVDSDLFFYSDPKCLTDEMKDKTVQIVEHRYNRSWLGKISHANSGTYCVEFNTFMNTPDSMELLQWWKERCYGSCTSGLKTTYRKGFKVKGCLGDQGYLEDWGKKKNVSVLRHPGGGVAPWNIVQYKLHKTGNKIVLEEKRTGRKFPLVFYHFHNISYYDPHKVNIGVYEPWKEDRKLVEYIYSGYLKKIDDVKNELRERFGVYPLLHSHPGLNKDSSAKRKSIAEIIKSIDTLFIPRVYSRIIGDKKIKKYQHLNIISFE